MTLGLPNVECENRKCVITLIIVAVKELCVSLKFSLIIMTTGVLNVKYFC